MRRNFDLSLLMAFAPTSSFLAFLLLWFWRIVSRGLANEHDQPPHAQILFRMELAQIVTLVVAGSQSDKSR